MVCRSKILVVKHKTLSEMCQKMPPKGMYMQFSCAPNNVYGIKKMQYATLIAASAPFKKCTTPCGININGTDKDNVILIVLYCSTGGHAQEKV